MIEQNAFLPDENKNKRLVVLTLASVLLCLSVFVSALTSFPLVLAAILYGRGRGYLAMLMAWILCFAVSLFVLKDPSMLIVASMSIPVTIVVIESLMRNMSPLKSILGGGVLLSLLLFAMMGTALELMETTPKQFIVSQIEDKKDDFATTLRKQMGVQDNDQAFEFLALLEQPEALATQVLEEVPGYLMMGIFLVIWGNLFLGLKSRRILLAGQKKRARTEFDLVYFKVPEKVIWAVIVALVLTVFGDELNPILSVVGLNLLKVLGVFYFFQGFGLYLSFLNSLRLRGFLRTLLIVLTVLMAAQALAIIGLFDMFFNFRRFLKK